MMLRTIALSFPVLCLLLPVGGFAQEKPVRNLGVQSFHPIFSSFDPIFSGNWFVFTARESVEGKDLNGDGFAEDTVLYVHDLAKGTTTNLPFAIAERREGGGVWVDGSRLLFFAFGGTLQVHDLETGTTEDHGPAIDNERIIWRSGNWIVFTTFGSNVRFERLLHVYDVNAATTQNLQLSVRDSNSVAVSGRWIAFAADESLQNEDFNGDGDKGDSGLHIHDLDVGITKNLQLAVAPNSVATHDNWLVFSVDEVAQGQDLNGDGFAEDPILHVHDLEKGTTTNLQVTSEVVRLVSGRWLVFSVPESRQGGLDLDGDGDADDWVLHVHDLEAETTRNLRLYGSPTWWSGRWLVFNVLEDRQGEDLNGDGDLHDRVLHVHDLQGDSTTSLGVSGEDVMRVFGKWVVFLVRENERGRDLNGDGDATDFVLHVHNLEAGTTVNLRLDAGTNFDPAAGSPREAVFGRWLVFRASERAQGGKDLNGDGDADDHILHVYDLETGITRNLELGGAIPRWTLVGRWVISSTSGEIHVHDLQAGTTTNLTLALGGLNGWFWGFGGRWLVINVSESQIDQDLNGDGDTADRIDFLVDLGSQLASRPFRRGDCNNDGTVEISDAIFTLRSLFLGDADPPCDDACDSNDDGRVNISDAINTLSVLFLGTGAIPLPGVRECGVDPTDDRLSCDKFERCP